MGLLPGAALGGLLAALLAGAAGCRLRGPGGPGVNTEATSGWTADEARAFTLDLLRAVATRSPARDAPDTALTAMARACFASPRCAGDCG